MTATNLQIKIASEPWELEQVYGLNYRTFVEEIPQHSPNEERRLIDERLARSVCFVCLDGRRLRGMVAGEIQQELSIPGSTLSHHLDELRQAGLVQQQREGRFLRYLADDQNLPGALIGADDAEESRVEGCAWRKRMGIEPTPDAATGAGQRF